MPNLIIIGVDPGTRVTGYGVIRLNNGHSDVLDYGCIRPPLESKLTERYLILFEGICELLDTWHPAALAVETQYVHKNVQSAIKLGMARGMILLAATLRKIPVFEYGPTQAKLAVVGHGRASKEQVKKMVQRLLNLKAPPEPDDAADALALAICHAHMSDFQNCLVGI